MKNRLRILFLSSEVAPFAKTGGLADVSSALPKALFEMGHDVRVMMPKYGCINERKFVLREVIRLKHIPVQLKNVVHETCAKSAFIPDSKVQVYFLDYKPYFDRSDLYVDPKTGKDYPDNAQRFALFCKAALEMMKLLVWEPQIIHCNDWQTALVPYYLKNDYADDLFFSKTFTVLTLHNMAYQGNFPPTILDELGLPKDLERIGSEMEFYGNINFLKSGILSADLLTTVSPTYAQEIQTDPELGAGLQGVLNLRSDDLFGILNGVDESIWNPEIDKYLPQTFSANESSGKMVAKQKLLEMAEIEFNPTIPLIGMISRIADQKGFDLIASVLDDILRLPTQLVILGTGDPKTEKLFEKLAKQHRKQMRVFLKFDNELAHLIEAGSDMFLMPSKYEPCGLNQMYSLKYGTVPIVRKTGGLTDTIIDFIEDPVRGNGFVFEKYEGRELLKAVKNAVQTFADDKTWQKLYKRGMKTDFSWASAAEKYLKIYTRIDLTKKRGK